MRADQRGHASSVDVLNFFCSSRRARQGVPGARHDTVRLSPPPWCLATDTQHTHTEYTDTQTHTYTQVHTYTQTHGRHTHIYTDTHTHRIHTHKHTEYIHSIHMHTNKHMENMDTPKHIETLLERVWLRVCVCVCVCSGPQPIHRLGETHSMLRTRKAAGESHTHTHTHAHTHTHRPAPQWCV